MPTGPIGRPSYVTAIQVTNVATMAPTPGPANRPVAHRKQGTLGSPEARYERERKRRRYQHANLIENDIHRGNPQVAHQERPWLQRREPPALDPVSHPFRPEKIASFLQISQGCKRDEPKPKR